VIIGEKRGGRGGESGGLEIRESRVETGGRERRIGSSLSIIRTQQGAFRVERAVTGEKKTGESIHVLGGLGSG